MPAPLAPRAPVCLPRSRVNSAANCPGEPVASPAINPLKPFGAARIACETACHGHGRGSWSMRASSLLSLGTRGVGGGGGGGGGGGLCGPGMIRIYLRRAGGRPLAAPPPTVPCAIKGAIRPFFSCSHFAVARRPQAELRAAEPFLTALYSWQAALHLRAPLPVLQPPTGPAGYITPEVAFAGRHTDSCMTTLECEGHGNRRARLLAAP